MGSVANKKIVRKKFYTLEHSEWEVLRAKALQLMWFAVYATLAQMGSAELKILPRSFLY